MKKLMYYPSIFTPEESNSKAKQMVLSVESSGCSDETLLMGKDALKESNDVLTNVLNAQKTNPYTQLLKSEDHWRDETHVGGRDCFQAMTHWVFDPEKQEAANRLVQIFERHGWSLHSYGYQKQSSAANSLIKELNEPANQKDIETCGMMVWYEEEVKAQAKFETVFNEKAGHEGQKELMVKRDAQIKVNEDIDGLVSYLNGLISFKKNDETFVKLYKDIDGILKQATSVARSRRTGRKTAEEENEE